MPLQTEDYSPVLYSQSVADPHEVNIFRKWGARGKIYHFGLRVVSLSYVFSNNKFLLKHELRNYRDSVYWALFSS